MKFIRTGEGISSVEFVLLFSSFLFDEKKLEILLPNSITTKKIIINLVFSFSVQ
jgi:hypothetical protein